MFTGQEQLAFAGFLAGYIGLTLEVYALDLRQYASWCHQRHLRLFQARRADVECFARDMEARGRARSTITRRLCTIAGFYRYVVEEDLLDHSPAAHVRRPRLNYESRATGLDRNELGALLVAAALSQPAGHALISLLALNGLRVSEATGANIEALGVALPGVPPTGKRVQLAVCVVAGFRDGKLTHEHIYWDQASVLVHVGLLDAAGLPVTGAEQAEKLLEPRAVSANVLLGPDWASPA